MLSVSFYAHASFRLVGDGLTVITDPYTPGPAGAGFDPIDESADLVLMSSATDRFHSDPSHIIGAPLVVNTLLHDGPEQAWLAVQSHWVGREGMPWAL